MKTKIILLLSLSILIQTPAQADTQVIVSLKGDPRSKPLQDTFLQDQVQEQLKRSILIEKQSQIEPSAHKDLMKKAELYYKKGQSIFKEGDYQNSLKYFEKAIQLNAKMDQYYHEFAINLYKVDNYRRSVAILATLDGADVNQNEVKYYTGLNFYRLKQLIPAQKMFKYVQDSGDEVLSPLAAMYSGIIQTEEKRYDNAKESFQFILDSSKDPDLDRRAESYIEVIETQQQFERDAQKKWSYSLFTGATYDENVLNVAANNIATGVEAYRLLYGGSISYKAVYNQKNTLIPQFSISDIYSLNKDFESDAAIQGTDPLQTQIEVPWRLSLRWGDQPMTLTINPAYSTIAMSIEDGSRSLVFDSPNLTTILSTSHMEGLYTDYKLQYSMDNSHLTVTDPNADQTSQRLTAWLTNTYMLDRSGTKTIFSDIFYVMNNADGKNNTYNKYLVNAGASYPLSDKWLSYGKVEYFNQDFYDSTTDRKDDNISLTLGAFYKMGDRSTFVFTFQYMDNKSSVSFFEYDKFVFSTTYYFNSSFF